MDQEPKQDQHHQDLDKRTEDRQRLHAIFDTWLKPYVTEVVPRDSEGNIQMLSLGCGAAHEAGPALAAIPHSVYTGIDVESDVIKDAKGYNRDLIAVGAPIQLIEDNIGRLDKALRYGIVIARHPPAYPDIFDPKRLAFESELDEGIDHLSENGIFFFTTEGYANELLDYATKRNLRILTSGRNTIGGGILPDEDLDIIVAQKVAASPSGEGSQ